MQTEKLQKEEEVVENIREKKRREICIWRLARKGPEIVIALQAPTANAKKWAKHIPFFRNLSLREIGGGSVGTTQGKKLFPDRLRRQDVVPNLASRRILKEEVEVEGRHGKINFARHGVVIGCAKTCWGGTS